MVIHLRKEGLVLHVFRFQGESVNDRQIEALNG
jgi:hypothetical protein